MQCYIAIILFPNKAEKYIIKVQDTNNQGVKCPLSVKGLFMYICICGTLVNYANEWVI